MARPKAKILIYNTSGTLTHTITSDALVVQTKKNISGQSGTFSFTLPAKKKGEYVYNDIGNNYKVKIYLGYGTLSSGDLQLTGKIQKFTSPLKSPDGWVRVFDGHDLGEVLERRQKTNKRWQGVVAADIVAELVGDLTPDTGLTDNLDNDFTPLTLTVRTETYLDLLKKCSDYWYSAGTQLKKDFYVSDLNVLIWKDRPLRSAGVETLEVGKNILAYTLTYDILPVKNNITVYGAASAPLPNDKDFWTNDPDDFAENWSLLTGTSLTLEHSYLTPKAGTDAILCQASDITPPYTQHFKFQRTLPRIHLRDINKLGFWYYPGHNIAGGAYTSLVTRLLAPSAGSYFETRDLNESNTPMSGLQQWNFANLPLGESAEYNADENSTGIWDAVGSPNWWDLEAIQWEGISNGAASGSLLFGVDKLYFSPDRWKYTVFNQTSIDAYGQRDAEFTDENLLSNEECEVRAKTLLYQLKDRPLRLDVALLGNTNVKIGDRLTISLPADNISGLPFDVLSVEHDFVKGSGFQTQASMIYGGEIRKLPPKSPIELVARQVNALKEVASELYSRVVR